MSGIANKRVLVTGADGFIGSHLAEMLVERGAKVRALCLYNSFNNWGWLEKSDKLAHMEIVTGDVRDPHFCRKLCAEIDVVFHLAALIAIPYSYVAPDAYVDTNVRGTLNICQAALDAGCSRVLQTSTSEVYGTALTVPIAETHPLQPQSPYSASKIGADAIAKSFFNTFNLPLVTARPFNTFGPRQSARAVIPNIISQIAAGKKDIALGDLRPTRDFNYVLDTCAAMIALAECDAAIGEEVNIGTNVEISIGELFETIRSIMNSDAAIVTEEQRKRPEKSEVMRLLCDSTKLRTLCGYKHQYSLRDGLEQTVKWFTNPANLANYKTSIYNI